MPAATALIVSDPSMIEYLSGFHTLVPNEREALLLITNSESVLMHAYFSPLPEGIGEAKNVKITAGCRPQSLTHEAEELIKSGIKTFMIDKDSLFVSEFDAMEEAGKIEKAGKINFIPFDSDLIWAKRMVKDETEIAKIKSAAQISIQAFREIIELIQPGVSELEIAKALDKNIRSLEGDLAFPTIVAFGHHTALPHHQPSERRLDLNMPILIDWGAKYQGYCADMTRSWWHGPDVDPEYQTVTNTVYRAYKAVLRGLQEALFAKQKITAADLDRIVRGIIDQAGFGDYFIHTTGHGLGLNIHEPPSLGGQNQTEITSGMVFTIEPGIYLQDKYGYRYEHTIAIKGNIAEELAEYEINYAMTFE